MVLIRFQPKHCVLYVFIPAQKIRAFKIKKVKFPKLLISCDGTAHDLQ